MRREDRIPSIQQILWKLWFFFENVKRDAVQFSRLECGDKCRRVNELAAPDIDDTSTVWQPLQRFFIDDVCGRSIEGQREHKQVANRQHSVERLVVRCRVAQLRRLFCRKRAAFCIMNRHADRVQPGTDFLSDRAKAGNADCAALWIVNKSVSNLFAKTKRRASAFVRFFSFCKQNGFASLFIPRKTSPEVAARIVCASCFLNETFKDMRVPEKRQCQVKSMISYRSGCVSW